MNRALGKSAPTLDPRTLKMATYALPTLPPPPPCADRTGGASSWPLYANDRIGDCTFAATGHLQEAWYAAGRNMCVSPSEEEILAAYADLTGYREDDTSTDNGAAMLDVLKYWRHTGIGADQIAAYVAINPGSPRQVQQAVYLFGGLYLGLRLPLSAQGQTVWDLPPSGLSGVGAPGSWGGHCVSVLAYDEEGLTAVSWGQLVRMHWGFLAYADEGYVVLSGDFLDDTGTSPTGLDLASLRADLAKI